MSGARGQKRVSDLELELWKGPVRQQVFTSEPFSSTVLPTEATDVVFHAAKYQDRRKSMDSEES